MRSKGIGSTRSPSATTMCRRVTTIRQSLSLNQVPDAVLTIRSSGSRAATTAGTTGASLRASRPPMSRSTARSSSCRSAMSPGYPRLSPRELPSADGDERLGEPAQDVAAGVGDHHEVLDARADLPGQVDARLDGHGVASPQRTISALRQARAFVDLEPHAVSQAMAEVVAVARRGDQLARDAVDAAAFGSRAHGVERREL